MKLSEFKQEIIDRVSLVKASAKFTFLQEVAHAGNNWAGILSTTFYTFATLIFINIVYSNVKLVAGYSYNEMLFYFLISQSTFYINWFYTLINIYDLIPDVNKGNLDLILTKPVPALFYLMTRKFSIFRILTEAVPVVAIIIVINWSTLDLSLGNLLIGFAIWLLGLITLNVFQFVSALPVFWLGESENIVDLAAGMAASGGKSVPLEGYGVKLRLLFSTLIPILVVTGFTTSVMLGKSDPIKLLVWSSIVTIIALIIRLKAWHLALKNYTSASS